MDDAVSDVDDDEVIICVDGGKVHSAWKKPNVPNSYTMYKRVDRKVKPVPAVFPEDARVIRKFPEDPLATLVPLPEHPPEFTRGERLSVERLECIRI